MKIIFKILLCFLLIAGAYLAIKNVFKIGTSKVTNQQLLIEKIESIGKLELVRYQIRDVVEHKAKTDYLPEASVLLIVKAEAVGCVDLAKVKRNDIKMDGDTVVLNLPQPEVCYVKIDHKNSKVYDTKMAFFREADLVDEAYKAAELKITAEVKKSDILNQTKANVQNVLKPILEGFGNKQVRFVFK